MKRIKSLFIISLFVIFIFSTTKSAQLQTSPYDYGDLFKYNSKYSLSLFVDNPWISKSFISPWANLNFPWDYRLIRDSSSSAPYIPSFLYQNLYNFSWMLGSYWNPLNGYYNFLQNNPSTTQDDQGNTSIYALINKPWKLQSYGLIGEEKPLLQGKEITIQFNEDNKYEGDFGCHYYFGTYETLNNGSLSILSTEFTILALNNPSITIDFFLKMEYLQALEGISSYEINQDNLKIYYNNNLSALNFIIDANYVAKLINKNWELQSYGIIGEEKSIIPDSKITIQFDEDKTYEGNTGCNHYLGTYDVSNNSTLSVSPLGGSDAACFTPPGIMEQEQEYLEVLENVSFFKISRNLLKLYYDNKQKVLNFLDKTNWLNTYIAMLEKMPVANPPAKIIQYTLNDEIVYYEPPRCCDIWSSLYDSEGNIICHPDGGLCGYGDGGCPNINSELKDPVIIWEDNR